MLDVLNLLYLGAVIASPAIHMEMVAEVPAPALHQVQTLEMARFPTRETCRNHGIVVGYERDWTEERPIGDGQVTIIPPDPGKIEGYAFLFNKRTCTDKPPAQASYLIFGEYQPTWSAKLLGWKGWAPTHHHPVFYDTATTRPDLAPKWLPQVLRVLEEKAKTLPEIARFLADMPTTAEKFDREGWNR